MRVSAIAPHLACAILFAGIVTCVAVAQDTAATPSLVIAPGTILSVRINEGLSSDQNQPGDIFSGTLIQPVVVRGIVVAQRGQMAAGRVSDTKRAGMISGTSRLGITLTSLTLVDGQTVPLQTQLITRNGPATGGRDAYAIGASTALGAMIGAAADWGRGAAIGAGTGAAAGTLGVLLTRGHPTVVYPETVLTFQVLAPVPIFTENALQAFHAVNPSEYQEAAPPPPQPAPLPQPPPVFVQPPPIVYTYPYPYVYSYPYIYPHRHYSWYGPPWYDFPYVYGPSFSLFIGRPYPSHRYFGPRFYAPLPRRRGPVHPGPIHRSPGRH